MPIRGNASSSSVTAGLPAATSRPALWILENQLSDQAGPLSRLVPGEADLILIESCQWAARLPFHKKKLVLTFSAMRHFARQLSRKGHAVHYFTEEESWDTALAGFAVRRGAGRLILQCQSDDLRISEARSAAGKAGFDVEIVPDESLLCDPKRFDGWLAGVETPTLDQFCDAFRDELGLTSLSALPGEGAPISETRPVPPLPIFPRDRITREVLDFVERRFPNHLGTSEGFNLPVEAGQVAELFDHFLVDRLPSWRGTRSSMRHAEPFLFHSIIDPYLNLGLVTPAGVIERVRELARSAAISPSDADAFLRQCLGVREYLTGMARAHPDLYSSPNVFGHRGSLPSMVTTGETPMRCLADTFKQVHDHGFVHDVQRRKILGNFLVIAETEPQLVLDWYLAAYIDSHEGMDRPNVLGFGLGADGGRTAGEGPPVAPAREICENSDYCPGCRFDPSLTVGPDACPYNPLFWDFVDRNRERLKHCVRLSACVRIFDEFDETMRRDITSGASGIRRELRPAPPGG